MLIRIYSFARILNSLTTFHYRSVIRNPIVAITVQIYKLYSIISPHLRFFLRNLITIITFSSESASYSKCNEPQIIIKEPPYSSASSSPKASTAHFIPTGVTSTSNIGLVAPSALISSALIANSSKSTTLNQFGPFG